MVSQAALLLFHFSSIYFCAYSHLLPYFFDQNISYGYHSFNAKLCFEPPVYALFGGSFQQHLSAPKPYSVSNLD